MAARSPEEIRTSIEQNRHELGQSLERLRGEVTRLTDWRSRLREHQREAIAVAVVAGFILGGGLAAFSTILGGADTNRKR